MARVTSAVARRKRHKRMVKQAKGAWGRRSKLFRRAKETVYRGMSFATRARKVRKGTFRRLWITRIRAACEEQGMHYNQFMAGLKAARVELNRKMLSDLAVADPDAFRTLVEVAQGAAVSPPAPEVAAEAP